MKNVYQEYNLLEYDVDKIKGKIMCTMNIIMGSL